MSLVATSPRAVVIGAGAAGLGTAAALRRRGVTSTVLDSSDAVGSSWRHRYDGLRLNTPGWMSGMPGHPASVRRYGEFPSRDDWVRYLEDYTAAEQLHVELGIKVSRIDRDGPRWRVATSAGTTYASAVVVATGTDQVPRFPDWPGARTFTGQLLHSADFRSASSYAGRDVLVVGANVSGVEIATLLTRAGAGRVRIAVRTPPILITRKRFGVSVNITGLLLEPLPARWVDELTWLLWRTRFGDLAPYGLPRPPRGLATSLRERRMSPAYDDGFVAALKAGAIEVVAAVTDMAGPDVVLADGSRIRPEVVVAATGYRRALDGLVGHLGVLDSDGYPLVTGAGQHPAAPGLYFNGFRGNLSGMLRLMRLDARVIARAVAGYTPAVAVGVADEVEAREAKE